MTNLGREVIQVPPTFSWLARAQRVLSYAQSLLLAFYKREYQAKGNHPPLSYVIQVHAAPYGQERPNPVLAVYHVSPDYMRAQESEIDLRSHGAFFAVGRGWIFPETGFARARLWLQPRPGQVMQHQFEFTS